MTIDKKVDCIKLAKEVVRQTRNDVLISKTQMTDIAARCNRNRTTVSRALDAEDMTLSMWFASVSESQIDPLELIAEKIREQSALADAEGLLRDLVGVMRLDEGGAPGDAADGGERKTDDVGPIHRTDSSHEGGA